MSVRLSSTHRRPAATTYCATLPARPNARPELAETNNIHRPAALPNETPTTVEAPGHWGLPIISGYEVIRRLGHGGMGIVYLAREVALNRLVAVKVVAGGVFADAEMLSRFRSEAEAIAGLQHPNIVQIFGIGRTDGGDAGTPPSPYIALEYVDGGSLAGRVGTALPPRVAARIVATLALAVQYAHDRGIVHRDLKPGNVLLQRTDASETALESFVPKVSDFGLAKRLNLDNDRGAAAQTIAGSTLGTPEYMAPEQATGAADIGRPADIYALGVLFYELLTGQVPHKGVDPLDTLLLVRTVEPEPPSRKEPRLPRDLDTICERCLQKDPAKRYATAADLACDLEAWLDGRPIAARRIRAGERIWKWVRRRPAIASLLFAVMLLAIVGVAGVLWQWQRAEARALAEQHAVKQTGIALEESETNLYFGRVHIAHNALAAGNTADAIRVLDNCRPRADQVDRRGWEWNYLKNSSHPEALSFRAGHQWVWDVAFSPDGRFIATAAGTPFFDSAATTPGELAIWEARTGKLVRKFEGHNGTVRRVAFSPDGKYLASSAYDKTVRLWTVATGQAIGEPLPGLFSNHHYRAMFGDSSRFWFDAQGRWIDVHGPDRWIRTRLGSGEQTTIAAPVEVLDRTADGRFALIRREGNIVELQTVADQRLVARLDLTEGIDRAIVTPDGKSIVVSNGERIETYDVATGRRKNVLRGPTAFVESIVVSADGRRIAAAGVDRTVYVWDEQWPFSAVYHGHVADVRGLAFSPDGEWLASSDRTGHVFVWDLSRRPRHQLAHGRGSSDGIAAVGLSADGQHVLIAHLSQHIKHLDVTGNVLREVKMEGLTRRVKFPRYDLQFAADGGSLFGPLDAKPAVVRRWDTVSGAIVQDFRGHRFPIGPLSASTDGSRLATCANFKTKDGPSASEILIWNVANGQRVCTIETEPTVGICLSADGTRLATTSRKGDLILRDSGDGRELWRQQGAHSDSDPDSQGVYAFAVAFSPDGQFIATGGFSDGIVRLWRADTGQSQCTPLPAWPSLTGVAFSPDSRRIVAGGYDSEVRMWDVATGQLTLILPPPTGPRPGDLAFTARPVFSQFNQRLAMLEWRGFIACWDGRDNSDR